MKKYLIFSVLAVLALFSSCTKGESLNDSDYVGGRDASANNRARIYMMSIADDLVAGALDELELALEIEARGSAKSAHFEMSGPLGTAGSVWTVKAGDSPFKGLVLRCTGADSWSIGFKGEFALVSEENLYPTEMDMTATRTESAEDQAEGWEVSLKGSREERLGYGCRFETRSLQYINTRGNGAVGWNQMLGDLGMSVVKNGREVDLCCLSFEGAPSQATFLRGL